MTVFEQESGCVNEWRVVWHERVRRFGREVCKGAGGGGKRVVASRWLGEPRKVSGATSDAVTDLLGETSLSDSEP